jgi:hypothetical protein
MRNAFSRKQNSQRIMPLKFKHPFRKSAFYNFQNNLTLPRHRWYPFKEGFSSGLVVEATKSAAKKKRPLKILDTFGGSGTTPLTAALMGHDSLSIEVNPFCAFASRVKCTRGVWRKQNFGDTVDRIVRACHSSALSPLENLSTFSDSEGNHKWLFNRAVIRSSSSILRAIERHGGGYSEVLRLAAIRATMQCCNAQKDGKCLRYYEDWKERCYSKSDLIRAFRASAELMLHDIGIAPLAGNSKIKISNRDARVALRDVETKSYDLLVTSPPYLNSLDYSDVYRPELFIGGFVADNAELRKIRLKTVRSHVQVKWNGSTAIDNHLIKLAVEQLKQRGDSWNKRIPNMVEAYFHDMRNVLIEIARVLRNGAEAWIVVSTSAYNGVQIPVDLILAELGCESGLRLRGIYVLRQLRSAGQQWKGLAAKGLPLRESLLVFKR